MRMADTTRPARHGAVRGQDSRLDNGDVSKQGQTQDAHQPSRPTDDFWKEADWLFCQDEYYRPVEPGTFPLADGPSIYVGRLRGYGNAIVAPVAIEFIKAALAVMP